MLLVCEETTTPVDGLIFSFSGHGTENNAIVLPNGDEFSCHKIQVCQVETFFTLTFSQKIICLSKDVFALTQL